MKKKFTPLSEYELKRVTLNVLKDIRTNTTLQRFRLGPTFVFGPPAGQEPPTKEFEFVIGSRPAAKCRRN